MMPRWLAVLFLVGMGAVVLAYACSANRTGEVRAGYSLLTGAQTPNRIDNPVAFRFYLALYFCGGIALCVWGLLVFIGMASPPHWQ